MISDVGQSAKSERIINYLYVVLSCTVHKRNLPYSNNIKKKLRLKNSVAIYRKSQPCLEL